MNERFKPRIRRITLAMLFSAGITSASTARSGAQVTTSQRQAMIERHNKMAEMHTNMAACLNSEKSPSVCRQEMIDTYATNFSPNFATKGMGKMGDGKMGGRDMMNGTCMGWMME